MDMGVLAFASSLSLTPWRCRRHMSELGCQSHRCQSQSQLEKLRKYTVGNGGKSKADWKRWQSVYFHMFRRHETVNSNTSEAMSTGEDELGYIMDLADSCLIFTIKLALSFDLLLGAILRGVWCHAKKSLKTLTRLLLCRSLVIKRYVSLLRIVWMQWMVHRMSSRCISNFCLPLAYCCDRFCACNALLAVLLINAWLFDRGMCLVAVGCVPAAHYQQLSHL